MKADLYWLSKKTSLCKQKAMTLVEILTVVIILGLFATIAIPRIGRLLDDYRLNSEVKNMRSFLQAARSSAILNNKLVTVIENPEQNSTTQFIGTNELFAFPSDSIRNIQELMKELFILNENPGDCNSQCFVVRKPRTHSKISVFVRIYTESDSGNLNGVKGFDGFGLSFDQNGMLYNTEELDSLKIADIRVLRNRLIENRPVIEFIYSIGPQRRSILICGNGYIYNHPGLLPHSLGIKAQNEIANFTAEFKRTVNTVCGPAGRI